MRIESVVAQQAVLAGAAPRTRRTAPGERSAAAPDRVGPPEGAARSLLPSAVADRLASLLDDDPAFAEAVSAHLPAARQATARDLAAYGQRTPVRTAGARIDISG